MDLTINNLIKIVIAVVVIAIVIFTIYYGMSNYIIPYFTGVSFGEGKNAGAGSGAGGSADVCDGKKGLGEFGQDDITFAGIVYGHAFWYWDEGMKKSVKTKLYLSKDGEYIRHEDGSPDPIIGRVSGVQIEIDNNYIGESYAQTVNGAFIKGKQVCK